MRGVALSIVIAACHSSSSAPPPPLPPAPIPATPPAPALQLPAGIDPAVATEFAKLAGVEVSSLGPLVVDSEQAVKAPAVVAQMPADRAQELVRRDRDHFAAQGYFMFRSAQNFGVGGKPDDVALLASRDQFDIVRVAGTDGTNYGIDNDQVIARLKQWDAKFGLVIDRAGLDWVEATFVHQPGNMSAFAEEVYKWCPDVVDQGTDTVAELAKEMKDENVLYLWWD